MASQNRPVDMELKKAFQELQTKMVSTTQQMKVSDIQIEALKRQITHAKLVQSEITGLPEGTRTYEGVGRMFLLQPTPEIMTGLEQKQSMAEEKIKSIETQKTYLEKSMKEAEDNLRELITSKQQGK